MNENEIRSLFKDNDVFLSATDVWKVQSAWVIKHSALERLAAKIEIEFDTPTIIRAERDEAVILVTGKRGDAIEWSIGEALIDANYRVSGKQAAYVWAMAEKRAKDRVILKLAQLYGAHSEDEADDFKQAPGQPQEGAQDRPRRGRPPKVHTAPPAPPEEPTVAATQDAEPVELVEYQDPDSGELRHVTMEEYDRLLAEENRISNEAERRRQEENRLAAKEEIRRREEEERAAEKRRKAEELRKQLAELDGIAEPPKVTEEQRKANGALTEKLKQDPAAIPAFLKRDKNNNLPPTPQRPNVPAWPHPASDPQGFLKRFDVELSRLDDGDAMQALWDRLIEPQWDDIFPPDRDEVQALLRHHMRQVER